MQFKKGKKLEKQTGMSTFMNHDRFQQHINKQQKQMTITIKMRAKYQPYLLVVHAFLDRRKKKVTHEKMKNQLHHCKNYQNTNTETQVHNCYVFTAIEFPLAIENLVILQ